MIHVLLPTDYSDNAFHANLYTAGLLGVKGVLYTLVHTWYDPDPSLGTWARTGTGLHQVAVDGMQEWEKRIRGAEVFAGAMVRTEILHGPLTGVMDALAEDRHADLIAMGTLGRTGTGWMGSNAAAMVKNCRFPLLVVPSHAVSRTVRRILLADDRQGMKATDVRMLLEIATHTGAELVLGHMRRDDWEELGPEVKKANAAVLGAIPHRYVSALGKDIAETVEMLAGQEDADMIAVLHRNAGFFESLFRSSTSKNLVLNSTTPLLVLQEG